MTELPEDPIPKPEPSDVADVVSALETAAALWAKGEQREGLRWLRRAAESAEQADNDLRALELARRAADLTGLLGASAPPPLPSAPAQPPPEAVQSPPEAAQPPPEPAPPARTQPSPPGPSQRASMPPAPQVSRPPVASAAPVATRAQSAAAALAPAARGQVRVFVKTSARDKALYIVRPLESGKRPPLGTREALLVFPED